MLLGLSLALAQPKTVELSIPPSYLSVMVREVGEEFGEKWSTTIQTDEPFLIAGPNWTAELAKSKIAEVACGKWVLNDDVYSLIPDKDALQARRERQFKEFDELFQKWVSDPGTFQTSFIEDIELDEEFDEEYVKKFKSFQNALKSLREAFRETIKSFTAEELDQFGRVTVFTWNGSPATRPFPLNVRRKFDTAYQALQSDQFLAGMGKTTPVLIVAKYFSTLDFELRLYNEFGEVVDTFGNTLYDGPRWLNDKEAKDISHFQVKFPEPLESHSQNMWLADPDFQALFKKEILKKDTHIAQFSHPAAYQELAKSQSIRVCGEVTPEMLSSYIQHAMRHRRGEVPTWREILVWNGKWQTDFKMSFGKDKTREFTFYPWCRGMYGDNGEYKYLKETTARYLNKVAPSPRFPVPGDMTLALVYNDVALRGTGAGLRRMLFHTTKWNLAPIASLTQNRITNFNGQFYQLPDSVRESLTQMLYKEPLSTDIVATASMDEDRWQEREELGEDWKVRQLPHLFAPNGISRFAEVSIQIRQVEANPAEYPRKSVMTLYTDSRNLIDEETGQTTRQYRFAHTSYYEVEYKITQPGFEFHSIGKWSEADLTRVGDWEEDIIFNNPPPELNHGPNFSEAIR